MSDIAIRVENLSKAYRITSQRQRGRRYKTLQEELLGLPGRLWRLARGYGDGRETMWALKDVSFQVKEGEVVGIIGRNGAGKSTLLKILSRITEPTEGQARVQGRVGSLLEVGTGFHPELTGRENVFLNGAILGMRRQEVQRKFDEIVAFAEVEQYIDTPVKRYSSGMQVRLAFAVAAHLEPEILLVDEVLAVGDAQFQKKCLGKMGDVAAEGRTVLYVSHNMVAVQRLCQTGIVLSHGQVVFYGDVQKAIDQYTQNVSVSQAESLPERRDRRGSGWLKFTRVVLCDADGNELQQVLSGQDVLVRVYYVSTKNLRNAAVLVSFNVRNSLGGLLSNLNSTDSGNGILDIHESGFLQCAWPRFNLRSGRYDCNLFCSINGEIVDWLQSAFIIHVEDGDFFGTGKLIGREQGDVLVSYTWSSHLC